MESEADDTSAPKIAVDLEIASDGMSVLLDVYPAAEQGTVIGPDEWESWLAGRGVVHGVCREAVIDALDRARADNVPVSGVVAAQGTPARSGEDARVEILVRRTPLVGYAETEDAAIDYHERDFLHRVKEGELLARKTPATPGEPGCDVRGKRISATSGKDVRIEPTGSAALSEDGLECRATCDGVAIVTGPAAIGVFREYNIPRDVDLDTGNLHMEGVLTVGGWIRSGFQVQASGDIIVKGGIEPSVVETDGNLTVRLGVVGGEEASITARGNLSAQYIENAHVRAGGDVAVREGIINSRVDADGRVTACAGKGYIIGGSARAKQGIEVNELGSRAGVRTAVEVGLDAETRAKLAEMQRDCLLFERNQQKIARSLAVLVQKGKTRKLLPEETQALSKLVHYRRDIELKKRSMASFRERLGNPTAEVKVRTAVYEGVVVTVFGKRLEVKEDIPVPGTFAFDVESGCVVYKP